MADATTQPAAEPSDAVRRSAQLRRQLLEAGVAAFVMLLLSMPMFAFKTAAAPGGLVLESRWGLVATLVVLAFVGKLAFGLLSSGRIGAAASSGGDAIGATWAACLSLSARCSSCSRWSCRSCRSRTATLWTLPSWC